MDCLIWYIIILFKFYFDIQQSVSLTTPEVRKVTGHWRQEKALLEMQIREMKAQNLKLIDEKQEIEEHLKAEIEELKVQVSIR